LSSSTKPNFALRPLDEAGFYYSTITACVLIGDEELANNLLTELKALLKQSGTPADFVQISFWKNKLNKIHSETLKENIRSLIAQSEKDKSGMNPKVQN
jgi:hypothetical protein